MKELKNAVKIALSGYQRVVMVLGNFEILHPGHIRLLKFAKDCGDCLVVGINRQLSGSGVNLDAEHRLEIIRSLDMVDFAYINDMPPAQAVNYFKPWAVVKGSEFEQKENPEQAVLDSYGGRLIFGSGDFLAPAFSVFEDSVMGEQLLDLSTMDEYVQRHAIKPAQAVDAFSRVSTLKIAVLGEVIIDEYIQGTAVGMSQEDPTIVMTPVETSRFLGGAAITASHIRALGAGQVHLLSVLGEDEAYEFAAAKCAQYQVDAQLFQDVSRPTIVKSRYRVENKTLLRVNKVKQHQISSALQERLYRSLTELIDEIDLLVFSDFNYGVLPQTLVERVIALCEAKGVPMVADSQTSSQVGDISRYRNMLLVTPTEKEVRSALNNNTDGLVVLAEKLREKSNAGNIAITLGADGVFIHTPQQRAHTPWQTDLIPALNKRAIDPAGGGDCFLATAALLLCAGYDVWLAYYVASIAAACQVGRVGNTPLTQQELMKYLGRNGVLV